MNKTYPIKSLKKINLMKEYMENDGKYRLAFLFILGINTPFRVKQLLGIKHEEISCLNLSKPVRVIYDKYFEKQSKGPVFVSKSNRCLYKKKKLSSVYVGRELSFYSSLVGVERTFGFSGLRKTYGYFLYKKTNNLKLTAKMLGYTDLTKTLDYIDANDIESLTEELQKNQCEGAWYK